MTNKEEIKKLRLEGKTYRQIQALLGCSLGTIAWHAGEGQKAKYVKRAMARRKRIITELKDEFGGKCSICGYNKYFGALEFHHIDPTTKDRKYKTMNSVIAHSGPEKLKEEAAKCVLLCANCHREVEAGVTEL